MSGTMEINKKKSISTDAGFTREYNSLWPPKCGGDSESLNLVKGKDFDEHVEAHESTCDTKPAGGAGTSEYVYGADDRTGHEYERE